MVSLTKMFSIIDSVCTFHCFKVYYIGESVYKERYATLRYIMPSGNRSMSLSLCQDYITIGNEIGV